VPGIPAPSERDKERRFRMKIVVDFDKCKSNAVCMGIAPDIFEVRDDNFLYVLQEEPPESARPLVEQAVRDCPTQAISLSE
jgi:ferredoxin